MGIPLRAWENYRSLLGLDQPNGESVFLFASQIRALDPTYADDFWSKPGYLGTEPLSPPSTGMDRARR